MDMSFKLCIRAVCLSLPPGPHQPAAQSQEEVGCLCPSWALCIAGTATWRPDGAPSPGSSAAVGRGQPAALLSRTSVYRTMLTAALGRRRKQKRKDTFFVYASHYMLLPSPFHLLYSLK